MMDIAKIKAKLKKDYKFNYEHYGAVEAFNSFVEEWLSVKK
jgi:hypothetical protein